MKKRQILQYLIWSWVLFFTRLSLIAQPVSMKSYFKETHEDSSFYCSLRIHENHYLFGGENGILYSVDTGGAAHSINYPYHGYDIYAICQLSDDSILLGGKSGTLALYILSKNSWVPLKVPVNKAKCIYSIQKFQSKIYICGGHNRIAHSGKTIPLGFVYECNSDLKDWTISRKSPFAFSFQLFTDGKQLLLSDYAPLRSRIFQQKNNGKWKKVYTSRFLFHKISQVGHQRDLVWMGGKSRKVGLARNTQNGKNIIGSSPFQWCHDAWKGIDIMAGDRGSFHYQQENSLEWKRIDGVPGFSIYTAKVLSGRSVLVAGHGKQLYKLYLL